MFYPLIHWIDPITFSHLKKMAHMVPIPTWRDIIYIYIYCTEDVPASTKCVHTSCGLFWVVEWWIAEGYMEAACKASGLKWSRAERPCCCVWGSKPAVWIVCNGEKSLPGALDSTHTHTKQNLFPLWIINYTSVYHSWVRLCATRILLYYTAPISPPQSSHLSQQLMFMAERSPTAVHPLLQLCVFNAFVSETLYN